MEDESTSRYPGYGTSTSTSTTIFHGDPVKLPDYMRLSSRISEEDLEDDVTVPGEEDVVSNFEFNETVIASCPICGNEMRAKLLEKGGNGLLGDTQVTLRVISRLCECPDVYLRYDN